MNRKIAINFSFKVTKSMYFVIRDGIVEKRPPSTCKKCGNVIVCANCGAEKHNEWTMVSWQENDFDAADYRENGFVYVMDVIAELRLFGKIKVLKLNRSGIDDFCLSELYKFISEIKDSIEIIILSYNSFGNKSFNIIKGILQFPNLKFLDLVGTRFSTYFLEFAQQLNDPILINKVIFCRDHSIWHLVNRTNKLSTLLDKGLLYQNWPDNIKKYYKMYNSE